MPSPFHVLTYLSSHRRAWFVSYHHPRVLRLLGLLEMMYQPPDRLRHSNSERSTSFAFALIERAMFCGVCAPQNNVCTSKPFYPKVLYLFLNLIGSCRETITVDKSRPPPWAEAVETHSHIGFGELPATPRWGIIISWEPTYCKNNHKKVVVQGNERFLLHT